MNLKFKLINWFPHGGNIGIKCVKLDNGYTITKSVTNHFFASLFILIVAFIAIFEAL